MRDTASKVCLYQVQIAIARTEIKMNYENVRRKGKKFEWAPHANPFILDYIENMN